MPEIYAGGLSYEVDRRDPAVSVFPTAPPINGKANPFAFPLPGYSLSEVAGKELVAAPYLVKGLLDQGETAFFYGGSGEMKSFVASDLALHVAAGMDWHGFRVSSQPCGVLVILGEGQAGYIRRLKALSIKHPSAKNAPVWVVPEPVALDTEGAVLRSRIDQAEKKLGTSIKLIVLDTFSLMLGDCDESSNSDVGRILNNARQAADGRALLFVHHTGHGDKTRERGAYQIRGNADVRVLVSRDEGGRGRIITVECQKRKDDCIPQPIYLGYESVVVGNDSDGDPITSLVMVPTTQVPADPNVRKPKPDELAALDVLEELTERSNVTVIEWGRACRDRSIIRAGSDVALEKAIHRIKSSLVGHGLIERGINRGIYVPTQRSDRT